MERNVGKTDAIVRWIFGLIVLSVVLWAEGGWRWLGLLGLIPIATAIMGYCPGWQVLGVNTCTAEDGGEES